MPKSSFAILAKFSGSSFLPKNALFSDHWASEILNSGSGRVAAKAAGAAASAAEHFRKSRRETFGMGKAPVSGGPHGDCRNTGHGLNRASTRFASVSFF